MDDFSNSRELSNARGLPAYDAEKKHLSGLSQEELDREYGALFAKLRAYRAAAVNGKVKQARAVLGNIDMTAKQEAEETDNLLARTTAHHDIRSARKQEAEQRAMEANPNQYLPAGTRLLGSSPNGSMSLNRSQVITGGGAFLEEHMRALGLMGQNARLEPEGDPSEMLSRAQNVGGQLRIGQSLLAQRMLPEYRPNGGWGAEPLATTFTSDDDRTIEERQRGVFNIPGLPYQLLDAYNVRTLNSNTLTYQRETAVPSGGGIQAENMPMAEGNLGLEDVDVKLEAVSARYGVTLQSLLSNADLQMYLSMRLPDKWRNLASYQLINHATYGLKTASIFGEVSTAKKGTGGDATYADDSLFSGFLDAVGKVYVEGEAAADTVVAHPYAVIDMIKELKSAESGLFRSTLNVNALSPLTGDLFGLRLINSQQFDTGTGAAKQTYAVVGAFQMWTALWFNPILNLVFTLGLASPAGPNVAIGHNDGDFVNNRLTFQTVAMMAPAYYRPKAICRLVRSA